MRDVDAGVAEPHAREAGCHREVGACGDVGAVHDRPAQRPREQAEGVLRPQVGDGVRAAVRHALLGAFARVGRVRLGRPALEGVAQHVEPGGRRHQRRLRERQQRVHDGERGPQPDVADPGLDLGGEDVEDRDRRALRAGARRGRDRDERLQRALGRTAATNRAVDVIEQVTVVRRQQVHDLGGVDRRAAADGHDHVDPAGGAGGVHGLAHRGVRRLHPDAVEHVGVDAGGAERLGDPCRGARRRDPAVGDDQGSRRTELAQVVADLVSGAGSDLQLR